MLRVASRIVSASTAVAAATARRAVLPALSQQPRALKPLVAALPRLAVPVRFHSTEQRQAASPAEQPAAEGAAAAAGAAEAPKEDPVAAMQAKVTELEEKVKELTKSRLYAVAETENVRKRYTAEVERTRVFGVESLAKDLLSVCDALAQATKSLPEAARGPDADPMVVTLRDGISLLDRSLHQVLRKHKIEKIDAMGATLDLALHDPKVFVDVPNKPANSVIEVIREGYVLGGRAIRPAEVIVARGAKQ